MKVFEVFHILQFRTFSRFLSFAQFRHFGSAGSVLGRPGGFREASGSARGHMERSQFFCHFWKIFIFEVFVDLASKFVKDYT